MTTKKMGAAAVGRESGLIAGAAEARPSAFAKIAAGLGDAIAYAGGDESRGRKATVDVKAVRAAAGKTQGAFAKAYGFPIGTVRDWEQGRRQPDSGSVTLLRMIQAEPDTVERLVAKANA